MPRRLRVFISSTMRDLANERDAVRRKLEEFNFEPVNAENILPDGQGSWARIKQEIATSDVVVLILGESYGWIPDKGPHAGSGKSVTDLEFGEARRNYKPVLPFIKRLDRPRATRDVKLREDFRRRIEDWDDGGFRAEFDLAHDLADKVARAMVELLGGHYLNSLQHGQRLAGHLGPSTKSPSSGPVGQLPQGLVTAVRERSAVALIGAGVSLAAGLPSAAMFIESMRERIETRDPAYRPTAAGSLFFSVATDLQALLSSAELLRIVQELVDPPFVEGTTEAHRAAVEFFPLVLTTNYDELLERAVPAAGDVAVVADDETMVELSARPAIVKLHGSVERPASLVLTEEDLASFDVRNPRMRAAVLEQLRTRPLVAVGSSLRDPGIVALLESARPGLRGWVVADRLPLAARHRLERWNLEPIEADAADFFAALRDAAS